MTLQNTSDMNYMGQAVNEALRLCPPVPHSTVSVLDKDAKIGKYLIKSGDIVQINFTGMHRNGDHW